MDGVDVRVGNFHGAHTVVLAVQGKVYGGALINYAFGYVVLDVVCGVGVSP